MENIDVKAVFKPVVSRQVAKTMSYLEAINAGTQVKQAVKADLWQLADNLRSSITGEER